MLDGVPLRERELDGVSATSSLSLPLRYSSAPGFDVGVGSIEHRVSKMDTLAGIAIKYGAEIADIKRMNGLATDLQMFAYEKLQIPLLRRHPRSPVSLNCSPNNGGHTRSRRHHNGNLISLQSLNLNSSKKQKASPVTSILQGYHGPTPSKKHSAVEGTEITTCRTSRILNFEDEVPPTGKPPADMVNGYPLGNRLLAEDNNIVTVVLENGRADISSPENSVRRRQKNAVDSIVNGVSSGRCVKGQTPRPKSGNKLNSLNLDSAHTDALIIIGDSFMADGFFSVRESPSTSNFQESKTTRTPQPEVFSKLNLDGSLKPLTSGRNKAAFD